MGKVLFGLSMSLDGFIADKNDDVTLVFAWFASAWDRLHEVVGDSLNKTGTVIMGHRSFDQIDGDQGWVFPVPDEARTYGFHEEMRHFVECVRERREPSVSGADGLASLRVCLQIVAAIRDSAGVR